MQQLQGTDGNRAIFLASVSQGVEPRVVKLDRWRDAGQSGAGDVNGRRHHVAAVEDFSHHHRMQSAGVAAGALVPAGNLLVRCGQQRAGAAGEIADPQPLNCVGVAPVHVVHLADGQPGQQKRRCGQGVKGSQIFAVGNQALEDAPSQVVGDAGAGIGNFQSGVAQDAQQHGSITGRDALHDVFGNGENSPVVDLQDVAPSVQGITEGIGDIRAADHPQGFDAVRARQPLVKHHGVGDDRASHPSCLGNVGHTEQPGDFGHHVGAQSVHIIQDCYCPLDAVFEGGAGMINGTLRD